MVEAGRVGSSLDVEAVVDDADEIVGDGGDDGRAAGRAEDETQLAGLVAGWHLADDRRRHGAQWALAGGDGIRRPLDKAKAVGHAHLRSEVIHLVIKQEAEAFDSHAVAETEVQGVGAGDRVAVFVDNGEVRGLW